MKRTQNNLYKFLALLCTASLLTITACDIVVDEPAGTGSTGDFVSAGTQVKYVSIGNSITAGYQSGSLYEGAQAYSFPMLLSKQMNISGFVQPIFAGNGIAPDSAVNVFKGFDSLGNALVTPVPVTSFSLATNSSHTAPYNNLGIPGLMSFQLLNSFQVNGASNPFFNLICRTPQFGSSVINQAVALQPNFITYWVGNNDVLRYASEGGEFSIPGLAPEGPTSKLVFASAISNSIDSLTTALPNAKLVVMNIPDIKSTPLFTTIAWDQLVLDAAQAALLNAGYAQANAVLKQVGKDTISFKAGRNGFVIVDTTVPLVKVRQAKASDLIILRASSQLRAGFGSQKPLPAKYVLDAAEVARIEDFTTSFNTSIKNKVESLGAKATLVDINTIFKSVATFGYPVPGGLLKKDFISGGIFSLDGVHPSNKGQAMIANEILKAINAKWNADYPLVNINAIPGLTITK